MDPLSGTPWSNPATVTGFAEGQPNPVLMDFAAREVTRQGPLRVLDIGCGAGRNAVPLADLGCEIVGIDLSLAMLDAARRRVLPRDSRGRTAWILARADCLPVATARFDLVVAHGIWNLSTSSGEFRRSVAEAARAARTGAALFVFTFSRNTLPGDAAPVHGEPFVFTQFSGQPQCFLTEDQLLDELGSAGFVPEPGTRLREYNRPRPGTLRSNAPVIYEGVFRRG